jgi:hypothetical protein
MKPKMGKVFVYMMRKRHRGVGFMQRNYFDLCGSGDPVQMTALNTHLLKENFLPGSNFPWASHERVAEELRHGLQICGDI